MKETVRDTLPSCEMRYRLLGHERVRLSQGEVVDLVNRGLLSPETMIVGEGERFAAPICARAEFRHVSSSAPLQTRNQSLLPASGPPSPRG